MSGQAASFTSPTGFDVSLCLAKKTTWFLSVWQFLPVAESWKSLLWAILLTLTTNQYNQQALSLGNKHPVMSTTGITPLFDKRIFPLSRTSSIIAALLWALTQQLSLDISASLAEVISHPGNFLNLNCNSSETKPVWAAVMMPVSRSRLCSQYS